MKNKIKKSLNPFFWLLDKICKKKYVKLYPMYLHWLGIDIDSDESQTKDTWISPTVFFDSAQYDLIHLGKKVAISFDAVILVHDFSIKHAVRTLTPSSEVNQSLRKPVKIGDNVFIGARAMILPGTVIGDNCIIGAGSVVKGILENNMIYCGNPALKIGTIQDYAIRNRENKQVFG